MTGGGGGVRGVTEGLEDDAVFIGERCIEPLVSQGGVQSGHEAWIFMLAQRSQLLCHFGRIGRA